jgi:4-hydroxy-tetrahydrodipicolinate synthase
MFHGSLVALVTPMKITGELDEPRFRALIERHIAEGTQGIIVAGTTGEAPTLTEQEKYHLIQVALEVAHGQIPIIAGTGTYCTAETIKQTKHAFSLGVDACLVVTPYYNKPTQEGLYQHYKSVAEQASGPILLYNVSSRTACDLLPETVARLAKISNIVGLKEASSDLNRCKALLKLCGESFSLYSGDDASSLAFMLQGGKGVISVTANVAPKMMRTMCEAALNSNIKIAGLVNTRLMPLHKTLFVEANPIPVKWAVQQLGWIEGGIRLPLTPLSLDQQTVVKQAMIDSGVL